MQRLQSKRTAPGHWRQKLFPYLLTAPAFLLIGVLILWPVIQTIWISVHDYYLVRPNSHPFIGLENFAAVADTRNFTQSVTVTILYILVTVPIRFILGLGTAVVLNKDFFLRGLVRAIVIIPWAMPVVVVCLLWVQMLDNEYGIIPYTIRTLGIIGDQPIQFLNSDALALPSAMLVNIWKGTPFVAIMLLAGLQSIPAEMYEVAKIDGASAWQSFWNVTLPLLRPVYTVVLLLLVIWTVKDFAIIYVLTGGGPAHATEALTIFVYNQAFKGMRMGEAAAAGMLLLATSMVFTLLYLKFSRAEESQW